MRGDRAIAAGLLLTSGRGAWFWKIAHDESAARASPGVQLTLDLTDTLLDNAATDWCDSCATAGHAMIDSIWRERRMLADQLIALGSGRDLAFAYALERLRRHAFVTARKLRDLLAR